MRISPLLRTFFLALFCATCVTAQDPIRLNDGGWRPVLRDGRQHLTAAMTPVRLSVRSSRPSADGSTSTVQPSNSQPVQVTVGGASGSAIEASAFVRPLPAGNSQASSAAPAEASVDSSRVPMAEAPYVPDPVTPAGGESTEPSPAPAAPAYLTTEAKGETSRSPQEYSSAPSGGQGETPSPTAAPKYADTPPRLPPTPPAWNDPALEVARQSLGASSGVYNSYSAPQSYGTTAQSPAPFASQYGTRSISPQSVYWQGQTPADLPPRLPGGATQPAVLPTAPLTSGVGVIAPGSAFAPTAAPSCDAYAAASPYTPYYPRTVASPSVAAYAAAPAIQASVYGGPEIRRGLLGQPVLRVPGQPLRNFLRFVTP